MIFQNASFHIASLRKWHGHNGSFFLDSTEIDKTLKDGRRSSIVNCTPYKGEWFSPKIEYLISLFDHRFTGAFNGTLTTSEEDGDLYISSTKSPYKHNKNISLHFSDGSYEYDEDFGSNRPTTIRCRLFRAEEIKLTL